MNNQNQIQNKKSWQEKKEEKQERKWQIEQDSRRAKLKRTAKKMGFWMLAVVAIVVLVWVYIRSTAPKGPDRSVAVPILGRNHIADGTTFPEYNSNPPTSGPHYPHPAQTGFYENELPDEQVVHNLEHGHVWVSYKPGLPEEVMKTLRKLSGGNTIVTMRSKNDTDIAVVAWGRLDKFNLDNSMVDAGRIKDFISRYQNQGPENISGFSGHLR